MNLKSALMILLLGSLALPPALAQNSQIQVTMSVPKSTFIALASPPNNVLAIDAQSVRNGAGHAAFRINRSAGESSVNVPLVLRSNTAYRLSMRVLNTDGPAGITMRVAVVRAYAGTARVMPDATNLLALSPASVSGPRISRGGNNSTADNALALELELLLPDGMNTADIALDMDPLP